MEVQDLTDEVDFVTLDDLTPAEQYELECRHPDLLADPQAF